MGLLCLSVKRIIIFYHKCHKFSQILGFYLILKFVLIWDYYFIIKTKTTKIALDGFV